MILCEMKQNDFAKYQLPGLISTLFRKVPTLRTLLVLCEFMGYNTRDFNRLNKTTLTSAVVHCLVFN